MPEDFSMASTRFFASVLKRLLITSIILLRAIAGIICGFGIVSGTSSLIVFLLFPPLCLLLTVDESPLLTLMSSLPPLILDKSRPLLINCLKPASILAPRFIFKLISPLGTLETKLANLRNDFSQPLRDSADVMLPDLLTEILALTSVSLPASLLSSCFIFLIEALIDFISNFGLTVTSTSLSNDWKYFLILATLFLPAKLVLSTSRLGTTLTVIGLAFAISSRKSLIAWLIDDFLIATLK